MEVYRIHPEASVYYVTHTIVDWLPVFVSEPAFRIVTDSLTHCHRQLGLRINAFVIMPTHLHAIAFDHEHQSDRLDRTLTEFRKFTGRMLSAHCEKQMPKVFVDALSGAGGNDRERRFWQPTRHPVAIHSYDFWRTKIDYLHANPCRKGLVHYAEDWRFSSARFYATESVEEVVPITQLEW